MRHKYTALLKRAEMSQHGYWQVTYSLAPGVDTTVTLCQTGITREQAIADASATVTHLTGQEVAQ